LFKVVPPNRSHQRAKYVTAGLSGFYTRLGMGSPPLSAPVIEAYCVNGLSERESSTRGTYRSVLRRVSGGTRPELAPRFSGSRAKPPYSTAERTELYCIARAQRSDWRARSALALISLSLGAGLRAGEIVAARRADVVRSVDGPEVQVRGPLARVVPVVGEAATVLSRLCAGDGDEYLFHPEEAQRSYANFVNDFCAHLVSDPSAPRLVVGRARSSYICGHLACGTPLSELLELTGIAEVESLLRYARHVPAGQQSKAELRAALRRP
jgi:integrase